MNLKSYFKIQGILWYDRKLKILNRRKFGNNNSIDYLLDAYIVKSRWQGSISYFSISGYSLFVTVQSRIKEETCNRYFSFHLMGLSLRPVTDVTAALPAISTDDSLVLNFVMEL